MPIDIAVVGCGPAGLAAALVLSGLGHRISIVERFPAPAPVGSGLILQPTGLAVLAALGLRQRFEALGSPILEMHGRVMPSGRRVLAVDYRALGDRHRGIAVQRAVLFDVLYGAVQERQIELVTGESVIGVEAGPGAGERVDLIAESGRRIGPFEAVVDASGAGSRLRASLLPAARPKPLSYGALWANVPWPGGVFGADRLEQRYVGAHTMLGLLPTGRRQPDSPQEAAFFFSIREDGVPAWQQAGLEPWKAHVLSIWPELAPVVAGISSREQLTFARYGHLTLRRPWQARVVFIGDAAHSTSPQLGQGANMALLDAAALGAAFGTRSDLQGIFRDYARRRRRHVRLFQMASRLLTGFYQSDSRALAVVRDLTFDPVARLPLARRIVAGLISGLLLDPLGRCGLASDDLRRAAIRNEES